MSSPAAFIGGEELAPVLAYLESRREIKEILVSGGDPLTAEDGALEELFKKLRKARPGIHIRLCSRVPVTDPARLGQDTIALLARYRPLRIAVHINHPRELAAGSGSPDAGNALASAVEAGIPVLVQTVLLRGINDNAETLAALFRECLGLGLIPYYLFQLDLAPGTAHFRVPLKEGLAVYRELGRLVPGPGLPVYAVDLPGGGGKIRLCEGLIAGEEARPRGRVYLLKDSAGKLWEYPAE
jgi:lysine 2,3-aminomutase